jgi:hypothetical protein
VGLVCSIVGVTVGTAVGALEHELAPALDVFPAAQTVQVPPLKDPHVPPDDPAVQLCQQDPTPADTQPLKHPTQPRKVLYWLTAQVVAYTSLRQELRSSTMKATHARMKPVLGRRVWPDRPHVRGPGGVEDRGIDINDINKIIRCAAYALLSKMKN